MDNINTAIASIDRTTDERVELRVSRAQTGYLAALVSVDLNQACPLFDPQDGEIALSATGQSPGRAIAALDRKLAAWY